MRSIPTLCVAALAAASLSAQRPSVEIGLTLRSGVTGALVGQECGAVTCTPFQAVLQRGATHTLGHLSSPMTTYLIAIGLPGPCVNVPGIANPLLLAQPVLLDIGLSSTPPFVPTPCQQGVAAFGLAVPATAPVGFVVRFQNLGFDNQGQLALGPAIEATVQ